jgi:hypothetical protein
LQTGHAGLEWVAAAAAVVVVAAADSMVAAASRMSAVAVPVGLGTRVPSAPRWARDRALASRVQSTGSAEPPCTRKTTKTRRWMKEWSAFLQKMAALLQMATRACVRQLGENRARRWDRRMKKVKLQKKRRQTEKVDRVGLWKKA